jgi:hypothetical protein
MLDHHAIGSQAAAREMSNDEEPDEVFLYLLQSTIASLRYWVPAVADAAQVDEDERPGRWRMSVKPNVPGACPVELTLRSNKRFDCVIAGEAYDNRVISSLDDFVPLVEAIAQGQVIQRHRISSTTGAPLDIETIVHLPGGREWRQRRYNGTSAPVSPPEAGEFRDRHFLPYRR